jgi:hypothetical protein
LELEEEALESESEELEFDESSALAIPDGLKRPLPLVQPAAVIIRAQRRLPAFRMPPQVWRRT